MDENPYESSLEVAEPNSVPRLAIHQMFSLSVPVILAGLLLCAPVARVARQPVGAFACLGLLCGSVVYAGWSVRRAAVHRVRPSGSESLMGGVGVTCTIGFVCGLLSWLVFGRKVWLLTGLACGLLALNSVMWFYIAGRLDTDRAGRP